MHRPDGVPDAVQQVKHGALLILAQFKNIGHSIRGTHEPDLRQYTHLGDGSTKTDGRIYDPKLGPNECAERLGRRSPPPPPKYPVGGDQPRVNAGSPTLPVDVSAALTSDGRFLTIAQRIH